MSFNISIWSYKLHRHIRRKITLSLPFQILLKHEVNLSEVMVLQKMKYVAKLYDSGQETLPD